MANTGQPNSAGSQYYITLAPQAHLDGNYAIFGRVIEGLEVVLEIGQVPTNGNNQPIDPVYIDSIRILTPDVDYYFPEENELSVSLDSMMTFMVVSYDENIQYAWYVNDENQNLIDFLFLHTFTENGFYEVKSIVSNGGEFDYEIVWNITAGSISAEENTLDHFVRLHQNYPNPFNLETTISFLITENTENTEILIYNVKGQKIKSFPNLQINKSPKQQIDWNGKDDNNEPVTSGIYFYKLTTGNFSKTRKMILVR